MRWHPLFIRWCLYLDQSVATSSVDVDEDLDKDIRDMVDESRDRVRDDYPEGSFQRVFWDQQEKAASLKNSKSMRWHPLFIRWCLYLRHLSGEAYEMMRNSKCIYLPSQRTLRDYPLHYNNHWFLSWGWQADLWLDWFFCGTQQVIIVFGRFNVHEPFYLSTDMWR